MPRYNRTSRPAAAGAVTGFTSTNGTLAPVTGLAPPWGRTTGARLTVSAAGDAYILFPYYTAPADITGQSLSSTVQWALSTVPGGSVTVYQNLTNASGTAFANAATQVVPVTANAVNRTPLTFSSLPSGSRGYTIGVYVGSATAGSTLTVSCARTEQILDPNITYADGASWLWTWDGTAGASTSTRVADDGSEWWSMLNGF